VKFVLLYHHLRSLRLGSKSERFRQYAASPIGKL
jgi:hypothetical protein